MTVGFVPVTTSVCLSRRVASARTSTSAVRRRTVRAQTQSWDADEGAKSQSSPGQSGSNQSTPFWRQPASPSTQSTPTESDTDDDTTPFWREEVKPPSNAEKYSTQSTSQPSTSPPTSSPSGAFWKQTPGGSGPSTVSPSTPTPPKLDTKEKEDAAPDTKKPDLSQRSRSEGVPEPPRVKSKSETFSPPPPKSFSPPPPKGKAKSRPSPPPPTSPPSPRTPKASSKSSPASPQASSTGKAQFAETVRTYFDAWGRGDIDACEELLSENVMINDTIFPKPFVGKKNCLDYLKSADKALPDGSRFIFDDMTTTGETKVAGRWHMELNGQFVPFSRGVSFWTADDDGRILEEYTIVEPPVKIGGVALGVAGGLMSVAKLFRRSG